MSAERGVALNGMLVFRLFSMPVRCRFGLSLAPLRHLAQLLKPVSLLPLLTVALPAFRASSSFSFLPRGRLAPFSAPEPRKANRVQALRQSNHSADPRKWRTSPVGHANLHYEQRPSLCVCGLSCPISLHCFPLPLLLKLRRSLLVLNATPFGH